MSVQQQLYQKVYALADAAQSPEQIKALQQHLSQSLQDNVIPAYVGVPLMQGLTQRLQQATPQAQPARPPVAQQVMQAAQQADMPRQAVAPQRMPAPQGITQGVGPSEGIDQLPSNLPTEGMAQGGIIAFAGPTDGSVVPNPNQGMPTTQAEYDALSPAQKQMVNDAYHNKTAYGNLGKEILTPAIIAGGAITQGGIGINNLLTPVGKALGVVNPLTKDVPYLTASQFTPDMNDTTEGALRRGLPPGAKEYAPEIQVPPSADANALQTPEANALQTPEAMALAEKLKANPSVVSDGGLGNLAKQLAANKTAINYATESPMTDNSAEILAMRKPEKSIEDFVKEREARIGVNPALATREASLNKMEEENKSADEKSPWMALMKAGLATMGGTSQFAGVNIGKGGEAGLDDYVKSQDKISTKKDKIYELQSQLGDAKRQEQLAAEQYGEHSKEAQDARNETLTLAAHADKKATQVFNATDAAHVKNTNALITSSTANAQLAGQIQLGVAAANNSVQLQIAELARKDQLTVRQATAYHQAAEDANREFTALVGTKGVDPMGMGAIKSVADGEALMRKLIAKHQAANGLPLMLPPEVSTTSSTGSIGAADKKSGADFNYIPQKG